MVRQGAGQRYEAYCMLSKHIGACAFPTFLTCIAYLTWPSYRAKIMVRMWRGSASHSRHI
eukprot:217041-Pyramimonas_sp.AAC.1